MDTTPTTPPAPARPQSLDDLVALSRQPKLVQFYFGSTKVEVQVRALTEKEWAPIKAIGADLKPPVKYKDREKKQPDGYDYDDAEYLRKAGEAMELRRAATVSKGLIGMKVPGATVEEQRAWLSENLPPQLIDVIHNAIRALTSEPAELASFSTDAG